jgi:sulfate/thiosulfate-binding protein
MRNILYGPVGRHDFLWKILSLLVLATLSATARQSVLLNVSFDVSRQLFQEINPAFIEYWKNQSGETLTINQSHAGSSKQARAVIDGLEADVVTLNQSTDIDAIAEQGGFLPRDWRTLFPNNSAPYVSTIVFLVRKGNHKVIKDWDDLVKPGVSIIVPNPKTSGNGRYSYLAAYAFALKQSGNNDAKAREFVAALFKNVPVLDSGGRAATTTFTQRELGDVLLTFESEALLTAKEIGGRKFQVVVPPQSIEAEMPVAMVEKFARRHGTQKSARAYLDFLYNEEAQEIIAQNFYRPRSAQAAAKYAAQFGPVKLATVEKVFGGWARAQQIHFADGGIYDQISQTRN